MTDSNFEHAGANPNAGKHSVRDLLEDFILLKRLGLDADSPGFENWRAHVEQLPSGHRARLESLLALRVKFLDDVVQVTREMDWREDIPRFEARLRLLLMRDNAPRRVDELPEGE